MNSGVTGVESMAVVQVYEVMFVGGCDVDIGWLVAPSFPGYSLTTLPTY